MKIALGVVLALGLVGCAPAAQVSGANSAAQPSGPKHVTVAIMEGLFSLNSDVGLAITVSSTAGSAEVERLVNAGLVVVGDDGNPRPELAETVPSLQNGLWTILPDGHMESTYRIRPEARWHDGTAFSADDVAFTARVVLDPELGIPSNLTYRSLERIEAPEPNRLVVRWKQPFIDADKLFSSSIMPKHLLESTYVSDKTKLVGLPYWTDEFIGSGPFKLRDWTKGSFLTLDAFDGYVLGRPKIDSIEVRIIEDRSTLMANVLAGTVDMSLGRGLSLEQGVLMRDQWKAGIAQITTGGWLVIHPQFIEANPPVITDARFRKALMYAINRQEMANTIQYGVVPVADSVVAPSDPDYAATIGSAVHYEYDPRRATQLIEDAGYSRGSDGAFVGLGSQKLGVEFRTMDGYDIHMKALYPVAEYWQQIGVGVETLVFPQVRAREREWVSTFPAFLMYQQGTGLSGLRNRTSSNAPLPDNNYVGQNYARYMNLEFDGLVNRYFVTIPKEERLEVGRQLIHWVSDQLILMGLYYSGTPVFIGNRLAHITTGGNQAWNAFEWDVT